ncbi:hypothetical protein ADIARSV_0113 [Arcticibacter svalbardensis MN12-7]|uniref:Uncharacterized protein n=1 Tax=Arcticibacter svalbardensis MN12-7 TaxID=1150600 RepID=R9GYY8_9SPHI|nr:hypothetical protein [Arcticibacter svalbardensis]EOR96690.1 hypothetical protein ADIARSV_0113 [Arcticibacter svalbardensis MN12-7]
MDLSLKKGFSGQTVVLKKDGFDTRSFRPETAFDAVSVINVFFWPGFIIDAATGSMMKYDLKSYELKLTKQESSAQVLPKK